MRRRGGFIKGSGGGRYVLGERKGLGKVVGCL